MSISANRSRTGSRAALLVLLAVTAFTGFGATRADANVNLGVLPLCTTSSFPFSYTNPPFSAWNSQIDGNTAYMGVPVGPGIASNCAAQLLTKIENTCDPGSCPTGTGFALMSAATAFPDTVAASGGDAQHVTISIPGVDKRLWSSCFPMNASVHPFCPEAAGGEPNNTGKVYYRFKDDSGNYSGKFLLSVGDHNPGFRVQRVDQAANSCAATSPQCTYQVDWKRGTGGGALQSLDAQIVLEFPIVYTYGIYTQLSGYVGIPMEIAAHDLAHVQDPGGQTPKDTDPPVITSAKTLKLAAKDVSKKGVVVPLSFSESSSASGKLTLPKSAAKKLGLGKKALVLGTGKSTAATSTKLTLKLNKAGKKALAQRKKLAGKKLKLTLTITATDSAGNSATKSSTVTIS